MATAAGCTSDAASGSGVADGGAAGIDVPLPTIGLGSDTGSAVDAAAGGQGIVDAGGVERVVMIGDSITVGSTPYLLEAFEAAGLPGEIGAQQGKRIDVSSSTNPAGTRIAEQFAATVDDDGSTDDEIWVVALGTNDIGQYATQDEVEQEIRDLLAFVPDDAPLVWINTWFRDRPEYTDQVNAAITAVVSARGNATIGDWASIAPTEGLMRSDGVHPNDDGARVFADLVATTVANALDS